MSTSSVPLARQRTLILALLLALAALAWAALVWQSRAGVTGGMAMGATGLTMGMSTALFLTTWIVMMVAMMFPTAAPMVLMFARISAGKREQGQPFVPTWVFVGAYLLVWAVAGVVAYVAALAADGMAERSAWLTEHAAQLGGIVLILAGGYQVTPLKRLCLTKCRTPLAFIIGSWRDGYRGALRMGVEHGLFCLGCCWLLFVLLLPLGMMNIGAMALLTALIFAEKALPVGVAVSRAAAAGLLAYGALVVIVPAALPTAL